jgi:hypothetical protein
MDRNIEEKGQAIILEEGEIFFFYRPRIVREALEDFEDAARFFMVLHPLRKSRYRLIHLGKANPASYEAGTPRLSASIDRVMNTLDELRSELIEREHWSRAWGMRIRPAALQAAEGIYALLKYRDNTHLIYALDYPIRESEILEEMGVALEGGYTANVRNPDSIIEPDGVAKHPLFPRHLQERFGGREIIPVDPVEFLNEEGAELVLTGVGSEPAEEDGVEFNSRNGSRTKHG